MEAWMIWGFACFLFGAIFGAAFVAFHPFFRKKELVKTEKVGVMWITPQE